MGRPPRRIRAARFWASTGVAAFAALSLAPAADAQDYACKEPAHIGTDALPAGDPALDQAHRFATGASVRVAVIDTGVASHPELGNVIAGRDFVDPAAPDPQFDCDSHGTVVAGIIAGRSRGVAPGAEVVSIRQTSAHYRERTVTAPGTDPWTDPGEDTEAADSGGTLQTLADAIHNALDEHAKVINISVVSCLPPEVAKRVDTRVVDAALARAEAEGAVVVAAAGNASDECQDGYTVVPAHSPTVIAVGARADDYSLASYSVPAPDRSVSAPGQVEAALASDGSGWAAGTHGTKGTVTPYTGTSFAAPMVSGAVALLRERHPHLNPAEIRELIYAAAEPGDGAVDPYGVITHLPADSAEEAAPLLITPTAEESSDVAGRGWVLAAAALALLTAAAVANTWRRALPHA